MRHPRFGAVILSRQQLNMTCGRAASSVYCCILWSVRWALQRTWQLLFTFHSDHTEVKHHEGMWLKQNLIRHLTNSQEQRCAFDHLRETPVFSGLHHLKMSDLLYPDLDLVMCTFLDNLRLKRAPADPDLECREDESQLLSNLQTLLLPMSQFNDVNTLRLTAHRLLIHLLVTHFESQQTGSWLIIHQSTQCKQGRQGFCPAIQRSELLQRETKYTF